MNRIVTSFLAGAAFGVGATAMPLLAAVDLPNTFSAGETASASEINANFEALVTAVENLEADVRDLENQNLDDRVSTVETEVGDLGSQNLDNRVNTVAMAVDDLRTDVGSLESQNLDNRLSTVETDVGTLESQDLDNRLSTVETDVSTLEDAEVQRLNPYLEVYDTASDVPGGAETTDARAPIVRVTDANLQIVNGAGVDSGTQRPSANGLGNLLVGYTRSRSHFTDAPERCSSGEFFDRPNDCMDNGHTWKLDHHSGSHNVVAGIGAAYSATGGLIAGEANVVNRDAATVSGGRNNIAAGPAAAVGGGRENSASGEHASISGGYLNKATGTETVVSGGRENTAAEPARWAVVSGGHNTFAQGDYSVISGGDNNFISVDGVSAVISGGEGNEASAEFATVSGSRDQVADTNDVHLP